MDWLFSVTVTMKADFGDATEVPVVSEVRCIPEQAMNLMAMHKICGCVSLGGILQVRV